jgi:hypothetical protein
LSAQFPLFAACIYGALTSTILPESSHLASMWISLPSSVVYRSLIESQPKISISVWGTITMRSTGTNFPAQHALVISTTRISQPFAVQARRPSF